MAQNDVYVYGVLKAMPEDEMVRQPPGMGEIVELMISRKQEET